MEKGEHSCLAWEMHTLISHGMVAILAVSAILESKSMSS